MPFGFPGIGDISGGEGGVSPDLSSNATSGNARGGNQNIRSGGLNPPFFVSQNLKFAAIAGGLFVAWMIWGRK